MPLQPRHQCSTFPGIGPDAESNPVTLTKNQIWDDTEKAGISPDPAAESKVGYIPPLWHAPVASSRRAWRSTLLGQARAARRGQDAGSALLRNEALHTVLTGPRAVSCLVFFAQSARSCRFTLGWRWRAAQAENQLDTGRFAIKGMASIRVLDNE